MSPERVVEIVENTWPALQRAETIFGSRTDTQFRGAGPEGKTTIRSKAKRALQ